MAETSTIEWTDATWNPITGCSVKSAGCKHCYAMALAGTRLKNLPSRRGLTLETKAGPVWTGEVRFNVEWLAQPLGWRRPRRIFVCAHGDLFHEDVPEEWIAAVFGAMALAPQHTFQVLTKRADRMREVVTRLTPGECVAAVYLAQPELAARWPLDVARASGVGERGWPLPNVWLGTSAEDQRWAAERVPDLLATPAAVRFLSAEPLLGSMDTSRYLRDPSQHCPDCGGHLDVNDECPGWHEGGVSLAPHPGLDWVVVGGESGPDARPMHPDWARTLRDQCAAASVPFFFKQWGAWKPICAMTEAESDALYRSNRIAREGESQDTLDELHGRTCRVPDLALGYGGATGFDGYHAVHGHGGMHMFRVGKAAAGRSLDGVEHDGMPEVGHG